MSALDIGWNTEAWAKTGFRPFGRDSVDCGANYGNGVHWSVPLTGLTLYSSDATLDLCLMYSSLSGTWSGFSIYILYFLCVFSRQLWCSMSRRRLRPYWHSNILEESSQLINTGLGSSHKYRRTSTSHSCPHYQHMRGSGAAAEGNKWDIWQSESHSNISLSRPGMLAHSCQEVHW